MIGATQALLDLLAQHPDGLTQVQAASALCGKPQTVGSRLSKMFHYGKINRRRDPAQKGSPLVYFQRAGS